MSLEQLIFFCHKLHNDMAQQVQHRCNANTLGSSCHLKAQDYMLLSQKTVRVLQLN